MTPYESLAAVRPIPPAESTDYGSFCHFAVLTRNYGDGFTGHFAVFAVLTRNYGGGFTGHFSISLF